MDKKTLPVCFTAVEPQKKRHIVRDFSKNARTYEYCSSMEEQYKKESATVREILNPTTWNHIFLLQRQSRGA